MGLPAHGPGGDRFFFPRWCFFHLYELSSWSRAMLVPLAIINHFKPTRTLPPAKQLHELYPEGSEEDDLGLRWQKPRLSWPNFFLACDRLLKALHWLPWKPWRSRAIAIAERWMTDRMGEGERRPRRDFSRDVEFDDRAEIPRLRRR